MKFRDWCEFNFYNDEFKNNIGDVYIKIFRKKSYESSEKIVQQLMNIEDAVQLFGEYVMFHLGMYGENGYRTVCVCIYKEN